MAKTCLNCGTELLEEAAYCPRCAVSVEGAEECREYDYEAFISYRHHEVDGALAARIQKALEGYHVPKELRDKRSVLRDSLKDFSEERLGKLFRDEDELPTAYSLSDQISEALKHSRFLIVICSPRTNESLWVQKEIETFASLHGRDHILLALVEGEPDESFPLLLRSHLEKDADGNVVEIAGEPLAADFRDVSRKKFGTEVVRLAAPLIGCGFDDLRQRMKTRRQRLITTIASSIAVVAIAFGAFSVHQQIQITENYRQVQINESEFLAQEANDLLADGQRMQAIQVALSALPESSTSDDRPLVPAAQLALESALEVYPPEDYWSPVYTLDDRAYSKVVASDDDYIVTRENSRNVALNRLSTGELLWSVNVDEALGWDSPNYSSSSWETIIAKDVVIVEDMGFAAGFAIDDGSLLWATSFSDAKTLVDPDSTSLSPDNETLALVAEDSTYQNERILRTATLLEIDVATGSVTTQVVASGVEASSSTALQPRTAYSPDGKSLAMAFGPRVFLLDVGDDGRVSGVKAQSAPLKNEIPVGLYYGDGTIYVVTGDNFLESGTCVEAFDEKLEKKWSYECEPDYWFGTNGKDAQGILEVTGSWTEGGFDGPQAIVISDKAVVLIDEDTGEVTYEQSYNVPVYECRAAGKNKGNLVIVLADGTISVRSPKSDGGGIVFDEALFDGEILKDVSVSTIDDIAFVTVQGWEDMRRRVFTFDTTRTGATYRVLTQEKFDHLKWRADGGCLITWTDRELRCYDGMTLNPRFTFDLTTLDMISDPSSISVWFLEDGTLLVIGGAIKTAYSTEDNAVAYRLSTTDGQVVGSYVIEGVKVETYSANEFFTFEGSVSQDSFVIRDSHSIRIVDASTGEELNSISSEAYIQEIYAAQDKLVIVSQVKGDNAESARVSIVDLESKEEITGDINEYAPWSEYSPQAVISSDGRYFHLVCSDGFMRKFDLDTGALVWTSSALNANVLFIELSREDNVFLQDSKGYPLLFSGETGELIASSKTTLPPIISSWYANEDDDLVYALWQENGWAGDHGLATISLDAESFGALSNVPNGFFVSQDRTLIVGYPSYLGSMLLVYHNYTLDELIALAKVKTAGFELSETDRHIYGVAE